jgi:hypothetical protein
MAPLPGVPDHLPLSGGVGTSLPPCGVDGSAPRPTNYMPFGAGANVAPSGSIPQLAVPFSPLPQHSHEPAAVVPDTKAVGSCALPGHPQAEGVFGMRKHPVSHSNLSSTVPNSLQ